MAGTILFLMNGWDSAAGGIQTVNRELVLGLARIRPDLHCVAMVTMATDAEAEHAFRNNVTMIRGDNHDSWSSALLSPDLLRLDPADVLAVAGHSYFSGQEAIHLRDRFFPDALAVQFIHMNPMRVESNKEAKADTYIAARESKLQRELSIALKADLVLCIGPRLHRYMRDQVAAKGGNIDSVVRLDCGLSGELTRDRIAPVQPTVLCLGRTESLNVKGLDIFAYAAGLIDVSWRSHPLTRSLPATPRFVVRGAEADPEKLEAALKDIARTAGGHPEIDVRPYTTNRDDLGSDLCGASAFIMPSREEGFGLVACEALSFDTPIVISRESGIAELIGEVGRTTGLAVENCVIDMKGDLPSIAKRFADATLPLLVGRDVENAFYPRLKGHLLPLCSWEAGARQFIASVDLIARSRPRVGARLPELKPAAVEPAEGRHELPVSANGAIADARARLMDIEGVVGVSVKYAIVALVERGTQPIVPAEINGTQVIVREIDQIRLNSTRKNASCELIINGSLAATVGLFGVDPHGDLFAVTVAHAFDESPNSITLRIDNHEIALSLAALERDDDWAVLRIVEGSFRPARRSIGRPELGSKVRVEIPDLTIEGNVETIEMSAVIAKARGKDKRYDDMFEVRVEAGIAPGASGALVTDSDGQALGILVAAANHENGQQSLFVREVEGVLKRYSLMPATIENAPQHPTIGIILTNGEAADTLFRRLRDVRRIRRGNRIYFRGRLNQDVRVICSVLRNVGNISAAIATSMLVTDHSVDAIFVVGLCGGLRSDQMVGDVIIGSEIIYHGIGAIGEEIEYNRPRVTGILPASFQRLGRMIAEVDQVDDAGAPFSVRVGPIASGDQVIRSMAHLERLWSSARDILAVDMESAGVADAVAALESELPVIVVRAIADLPGSKESMDRIALSERAVIVTVDMAMMIDSDWTLSKERTSFFAGKTDLLSGS